MRSLQIDLIRSVGSGFGKGLKLPGVAALLAFSRGPAKLAGLSELQGFLERGVAALEELGDADAFVGEIEHVERKASSRLFAGQAEDRKGAVSGTRVSVRVDLGGRRIINQQIQSIYTDHKTRH